MSTEIGNCIFGRPDLWQINIRPTQKKIPLRVFYVILSKILATIEVMKCRLTEMILPYLKFVRGKSQDGMGSLIVKRLIGCGPVLFYPMLYQIQDSV